MALELQNTRVGFIGLGIMAGHLQAAGYPRQVYNRSPGKAQPPLAVGATRQEPSAALAQGKLAWERCADERNQAPIKAMVRNLVFG